MSPVEVREEPAGAPASRELFAEYLALVRERLGAGFTPTERIFAFSEGFDEPGAAWLVLYEDGRPVGCGGLRPLGPRTGEIKRMYVAARARGRGHGRRLLAELEHRAAAADLRRILLLTTIALTEARVLYRAEGYRVAGALREADGRLDLWLAKDLPMRGGGRSSTP